MIPSPCCASVNCNEQMRYLTLVSYAALAKPCLHQEPGRYDGSQSTRSAVGMRCGCHGAILDASVTPTPRKIQGKRHDTLAPEGQEPRQRSLQPGVDKEAKWVKKGSQPQYGYQHHDLAEENTGLVSGTPYRCQGA
jgi:hypothetical protein